MRLKSIQMQGFKSFADKIYLDFNSGVTAIVGPNGSGKSNISDAIRWVMGEQSIKSLRGSKMEDVIFAGTESRKPLGFAEVVLVLDNTDNYFSLDFPEITVTRRVYRSGEGEYYINKTLCRLKDIHELFMDTGLGRDGYSIIGQGKIDSILSTKSEDRRQIFEEAAGISKYKYRKIEAERKLTSTVENLTRVLDILAELESQLDPLSRQAEKAKKYLVLRDELRGLDINASIINIDKIKEELGIISKDLDILNSQINNISQELADTDTEISAMYDKMRDCDNKIAEFSEKEREFSYKISEAEKSVGIFKNDIEHNISNIERLEIEIHNINESVAIADKELDVHKSKLAQMNDENHLTTSEIDEVTTMLTKIGENAGVKSDELEGLKSEIIDLTSSINSMRGSIENLKILSTSFDGRKNEISLQLDAKNKDKAELDKQLNEATKAENEFKALVEDKDVLLRKAEKEFQENKDCLEKTRDLKNKHLLEISQKQSRKTMLLDMEKEFDGYNKGVKSVMTACNEGKISKKGVYGPLAQLIKTDKKYIIAIETALGGVGQNIVTETECEAKNAIKYLKDNHLGRATFLPLSAIKSKKFDNSSAKKLNGYISVASNLIDCDEKYKEIVDSFLGSTVVCDSIDNAISMAKATSYKFRIVTLGGELIQPGGAMTGGSLVKTTGSLSRMGEIDSLTKDIDNLEIKLSDEEKQITKIQTNLDKFEKTVAVLTSDIQDIRTNLVQKSADRERILALVENLEVSNSQLEKELDEINLRLGEIFKEIGYKNDKIELNSVKRTELEENALKLQEEYSKVSGENDKLTIRLTELNIKKSTILKDIELENERISSITDIKGEQLESINIKRGGIETLKSRNLSIEEDINNLNNEITLFKEQSSDCIKNSDVINELRLKTENEIRLKQNEVKDTQEKKFILSQKASRIESRCEKLSNDKEAIINRIWEDYELTYSDALELKIASDFDYKTATDRIKELKESIKNLGNINIDAIEEYKNVKERYDFLIEQTQDLEKSKAELDRVISEMMEIMQSRFAEQFKVINTNFNRVFAELFGGGKATLSLTDPNNVLESGIEIEAQPPGKKLQSLTLLSGGERAFTAIALLFAILDVRPTPFCILDEIEAALDDVNVYRYADYLKKYSKKTQFIVVTHRRGTMEAANILYGVTMQEKGISKLLTLNIDEIKE